jgi:RNA-directed DNA polymerase
MKRHNHLFEQITDCQNLLAAFYKARKGKRKNANVAVFEARLEWELLALREELRSGTYQPGKYRTFLIRDPKERMISAAPFRDRVVHHALCNVIEPIFDRTFIHDSYANRKGRGTHAGIRKCQAYLREYPYALKADIRKYFPTIDHELLMGLIEKKIKCRQTLALCRLIIANSNPQEEVKDYFPGDDLFSPAGRRKGLPMGNLTSQFFANLYLSPLDHFVKEELRVKGYARYVDDFVLFGQSKKELWEKKSAIDHFLATQLRLRLHPGKTRVFPSTNGAAFLGQKIFQSHRVLLKDNVKRMRRRLRKRLALFQKKELSAERLELQLNSWLGHARQAHSHHLVEGLYRRLKHENGVLLFVKPNGAWAVL